jgi:hypothetical protein
MPLNPKTRRDVVRAGAAAAVAMASAPVPASGRGRSEAGDYPEVGAPFVSVQDRLRENLSVLSVIPQNERAAILARKSDYNAAPDINSAIHDVGVWGGGIISFPAGGYVIQPESLGDSKAILIAQDNISLVGAGREYTTLSFRLYNGTNSAEGWRVMNGAVIRGHAIFIDKKEGGIRRNVRISDLTLDGGAPSTGNTRFPADPQTGDGWDLTHKGICICPDSAHDGIRIERVAIQSFRGELMYYGGAGLDHFKLLECVLADTNADGLSAAGVNSLVSGNEFYRCCANAIENAYGAGFHTYVDNLVRDCPRNGMAIFPAFADGPWAHVDIIRNRFLRVTNGPVIQGSVIYAPGAKNMRILDNLFIDCRERLISLISVGHGGSNLPGKVIVTDAVEVAGNKFIADQMNSGIGVFVSFGYADHRPANVCIHNNNSYVTSYGKANGRTAGDVVYMFGESYLGDGVRFEQNAQNGSVAP